MRKLIFIFFSLLFVLIALGQDESVRTNATLVDDLKFDDYVYTADQSDIAYYGKMKDSLENANPQLKNPPKNVDDLIDNQKAIISVLTNYSGASIPESRDLNLENINFQLRDDPEPISSGGIFTNSYFDGHTETNNIVAFYPFYKIGAKYLNFGYAYPNGNMTQFGAVNQWKGPASSWPYLPGSNTVAEAIELLSDDSTYMGLICDGFDPLADSSKFTIMAWIQRSGTQSSSAGRIIADMTKTTSGYGFQLRFAQKGDGSELQLWVNPGSATSASQGATGSGLLKKVVGTTTNLILNPGDPDWHHIAVSYDNTKTSGNVNFYLDGKLYENTTYRKGSISNNTTAVYIGSSSGGNTWQGQMLGYMDDLILFKNWTPSSTTISDGRNKNVAFWMDMNDSILGIPSLTDVAVRFGQFDPAITIYSADQVNRLINANLTQVQANSIIGEEPTTFGQTDPRTEIYSSDQVDMLHEYYR